MLLYVPVTSALFQALRTVYPLPWTECPCHPRIHVEILIRSVVVSGDGAWGRWSCHDSVSALNKKTQESSLLPVCLSDSLFPPYDHTARRQLSERQEEVLTRT